MDQQEMIERAREMGKEAFLSNEPPIPALHRGIMDLTKDLKVGEGAPVLKAFIAGWHTECDESLAAILAS